MLYITETWRKSGEILISQATHQYCLIKIHLRNMQNDRIIKLRKINCISYDLKFSLQYYNYFFFNLNKTRTRLIPMSNEEIHHKLVVCKCIFYYNDITFTWLFSFVFITHVVTDTYIVINKMTAKSRRLNI